MSESDTNSEIALPATKQHMMPPRSPRDNINKKITTKMMIEDALVELKSRKGVSLYAIKKHLKDKYEVDIEKLNYLIKKTINSGVQDGTFIQLKGVGAAGSFKLSLDKEKTKKKETKKIKEKSEKAKIKKKKIAKSPVNKNEAVEIVKKKAVIKDARKTEEKSKKMNKIEISGHKKKIKEVKIKAKDAGGKEEEPKKENKKKKPIVIAKGLQTPSKKRGGMMKRKSIGSIIKTPKMKPK